ncbi:MAG: hypothetical protein K2Y37_25020 [Pirellulales bacterium]|nr:hypothetical protein [Pirellulales bacterium]
MPIKRSRSLWWRLSQWTPTWKQPVPAFSAVWQGHQAHQQAARRRELYDQQRMLLRRRQQRTMARSRLGNGSRPDTAGVV